MKKIILIILSVALLFPACKKDPKFAADTLGGSSELYDPSFYTPEKYLVSAAKPNPTPDEAKKPVIIVVHGYSATTFEWNEFRTWAGGRTDFAISQVLLGGHGLDYANFKSATWQVWKQPIMDEYSKLEQQGYTNISLAGSSTGATLILEILADGYFNNHIKPKHVFMVDPIIIPANKTLSLVDPLGPVIGYTSVDNSAGEEKYYFHYRPYESLQQLNNVINIVRKQLQAGVTLPANCTLKVFKADKDDTADPVSAVLIYLGTKTSAGAKIDVQLVNSSLHVFTRLALRDPAATTQDIKNQTDAFTDIANTLIH